MRNKERIDPMKSYETRKDSMRPVIGALATAAAGAAFPWVGMVMSLIRRGTDWRPPFSFRRQYHA